MTATYDVQINGNGYMLVPGSYRYSQKGSEVAAIRAGIGSFATKLAAGASGPLVVDRDAVRWLGIGMMPVPIGLGLEAGRLILTPREGVTTGMTIANNVDVNLHGIVYLGDWYFSNGANLYKIAAGAFTGAPTLIGAAGGTITSMAVIDGLLYMATTAVGTMSNYAAGGAIANTPAAPAAIVWGYASGIWRAKGNDPTTISGSADGGATWTQWTLDSTVRAVTAWRGRATGGGVMLIATRHRLWELAGQWTGSPAAFTGTVSVLYDAAGGGGPDDFGFLVEYQGAIYTWYAGTVQRWDGVRLQPVPGGPRGTLPATPSACVAGGYLIVAVNDGASGTVLWMFDGLRWTILRAADGSTLVVAGGTDGAVTDGHLIVGTSGAKTMSRWLMPVTALHTTGAVSGQVIVGPLDGGQGDALKVWAEIVIDYSALLSTAGAAPGSPPGGALLIEHSTDDGQTWTTAGTIVIAAASRSGSATQSLNSGAGIEAVRLMVRVTWTPTSNYPAFQIDGVWASGYKIADAPREETWEMDIHVSDRLVRRDGSVDTRTGEQMLTALRMAAQNRPVFSFQDLDFDISARTVNARLLEMSEKARKGDGSRYMESTVHVKLAAVN